MRSRLLARWLKSAVADSLKFKRRDALDEKHVTYRGLVPFERNAERATRDAWGAYPSPTLIGCALTGP